MERIRSLFGGGESPTRRLGRRMFERVKRVILPSEKVIQITPDGELLINQLMRDDQFRNSSEVMTAGLILLRWMKDKRDKGDEIVAKDPTKMIEVVLDWGSLIDRVRTARERRQEIPLESLEPVIKNLPPLDPENKAKQ